MKLLKHLLTLALTLSFAFLEAGPNIDPYSEIGLFGGTSYYIGEINRTHFPFRLMQPAAGLFYRYNLNGHYALRAFVNYSEVKAYDAYSTNSFNLQRALSFKSPIIELGGHLEFNFYEFALLRVALRKITPFVFGGINYFYFNPQGDLGGGNYVNLQPLKTEGKRYSRHQIAIPVGVGVKFKFGRLGLSAEWGIRKTFTDYIDDVSSTYPDPTGLSPEAQILSNKTGLPYQSIIGKQRGDSTDKDYYIFTGFTVSYRINKVDACPDFKSRK